MTVIAQLKGADQVLRNMKSARKKLVAATVRGLKKGGLFLQRESQKIVPVDTGNLRGSAFTRALGSGERTDVIVGYTAAYAVYVHENLEAKHGKEFNEEYGKLVTDPEVGVRRERLRGEDQQAKFLEKPAREKRNKILQIVFNKARHPGEL